MEIKEDKPLIKGDLYCIYLYVLLLKVLFYYIGYHVVLQTPQDYSKMYGKQMDKEK